MSDDAPQGLWGRFMHWMNTTTFGLPPVEVPTGPATQVREYRTRRAYQNDVGRWLAYGWTQASIVEHRGRIVATYIKERTAP